MEAFWAITLSVLVIRAFWKSQSKRSAELRYEKEKAKLKIDKAYLAELQERATPVPLTKEQKEAAKLQKDIDKQKEREINELRKQGYTEDLIAVIIPTINNGQ